VNSKHNNLAAAQPIPSANRTPYYRPIDLGIGIRQTTGALASNIRH